MVVSKLMCDDILSNKSWRIVAQEIFQLREINHMERLFGEYLEWKLHIVPSDLLQFAEAVKETFGNGNPTPPADVRQRIYELTVKELTATGT